MIRRTRHRLVLGALALFASASPGFAQQPAPAGPPADPKSPIFLELSEVAEGQGNPGAALRLARQAEEAAPESPAAALAVGRLLAKLGAETQALDALARARRLDPHGRDAYLIAALLLRDLDRPEKGVEILQAGREAGVEGPEVERELGLLHLASGRPREAREVAGAALERHPDDAGLALAMGLASAADPEHRSKAAGWLEKALALGVPDPGRVHLELGGLLTGDEALSHLREAARLLDSPEAHYRLGAVLRAAGRREEARAALERYQELNRKRDEADWAAKEAGTALNEAQELANVNRLPEALERLDAVLAGHPDNARTRALRAKVLFSLGRRDEALEEIVTARELMPGRVEHHYLEALFLIVLGRPAEAETALLQALALNRDLPEARELLRRARREIDDG